MEETWARIILPAVPPSQQQRGKGSSSSLSSSSSVVYILSSDDGGNVVLCAQCSRPFPSEAECSQHMAKVHSRTSGPVTGGEITKKPDDLKRTRKPSIKMKDFVTVSLRPSTPEEEPPHQLFSCVMNGCQLKFRPEKMSTHVNCHVQPQEASPASVKFRCPMCPAGGANYFDSWPKCSMHLWTSHQVDTGLQACTVCPYKTVSRSKLSVHQQIHSEERSFGCSVCSKRFKQLAQLKNHSVIHMSDDQKGGGSAPLWYTKKQCELCQKFFSDSKCLKKHIQAVHSKLKPYICQVCNHQSARKSMLELHMRQHTGEKPYSCDICGNYRTGDHNSLRRHKMRHTGERPYQCPFCNYATVQSECFKKHIYNNHGEQPSAVTGVYACPQCPYKTVKTQSYLGHLRIHEAETAASPPVPQATITIEEQVLDTEMSVKVTPQKNKKQPNNKKGKKVVASKGIAIKTKVKKVVKEVVKPAEDEDSLFTAPTDHGGTTIPA